MPQIRPRYIAKIDEHVYLQERLTEETELIGRGDVTIARRPRHSEDSPVAVMEPSVASTLGELLPATEVTRLSYVTILDRQSREVVTVIELLSPSNKGTGGDRVQYLGKRMRIIDSTAHLVEIDLLRGGRRPPTRGVPPCGYCITVSRAEWRPKVELWPLGLRDPLPRIPIPLRSPDRDAVIDLKAVLERVHDAAGYADYLYDGEPEPGLEDAERTWARALLREAGIVSMEESSPRARE